MSLNVTPELLEQAGRGDIDEAAFADSIRTSLPYAYELIESLTARLAASPADFADNTVPPPSEAERGQLLRALASDAIRGCLERQFGVRLAFQNCHRVAVFRPGAEQTASFRRFTSVRSQILNQSPELRDC
jgi:hypothetical protein